MPLVLSSAKALIHHQGRVLLLREALPQGDVWDLPGGKIEYGESPQQALQREVKEELDLQVEVQRSVGVWYFFSTTHRHQVICHTFWCAVRGSLKIDTSKNPADENIAEWRWLSIAEILASPELELAESLRELLAELSKQLWWTYIVACADGSYYTGIARDLDHRLQQHNLGKGAKYTAGRGPVQLRYCEVYEDRAGASRREHQLKQLSRREKEALIFTPTSAAPPPCCQTP